MKKLLLFTIFILTSSIILAQDNNNKKSSFEKEWEEVKKYDEEKLPQSAIKVLDSILKQAIESKNNQQVIKALIHKNRFKQEIDPTDDHLIIDLQGLLNDSINIAEKALLQSMLAELYKDSYSNNIWKIKRRNNIVGFVPSDINEWTKNIYIDTIYSMLSSSVEQKEELKKITTENFKDILVLGKDSRKFYPTLYDFLMDRAINISCSIEPNRWDEEFRNIEDKDERNSLTTPAKDFVKLEYDYLIKPISPFYFFRNYSLDLISRNMIPTLILTDLDRLSFVHEENNGFSIIDYNWDESIWIDELRNPDFKLEENLYYGNLSYYKDMEMLEQVYSDQPESVEIIYDIVQLLNQINSTLRPADIIYEWVQKGIKKYPDYPRTELLKIELGKLENPSIKFKGTSLFYPTKDVQIDAIHKNLQMWGNNKIRVFKVSDDEKCELLSELSPELISKKTYLADTLALNLGKMEYGHYLLAYGKQSLAEIDSIYKQEQNNKKREYYYESSSKNIYQFTVSSFASFSRQKNEGEFEVYVVDRLSGKPLNNIDIDFYPYNIKDGKGGLSKEKTTIRTNKNGKAIYHAQKREAKDRYYAVAEYIISKGNDRSKPIPLENDYRFTYAKDYDYKTNDSTYINLFTDRNIYRPGQTVYYKAVYVNTKDSRVISNKELTVELFGDNKIAEQKKKTNEFGSISGEFVLPKVGLNGEYRISINNQHTYLRVEEYKRPSYEITFDEITKTYKQGDEVVVKGYAKNFSGVSLQNMDVNYTVSRSAYNFRWGMPPVLIESGVVQTDGNGAFEIKFIAQFDININRAKDRNIYDFIVDALVTDVNGETQSSKLLVPIGALAMKLSLDMPYKVDKEDTKPIIIKAKNLNNKPISTEGEYTLYRLDENDSIQSQILKGSFTANIPSDLGDKLKKIESGKYRLIMTAKDDLKREVEEKKDFLLYSFSDKRPPYKTNEWLIVKNDTISKKRDGEFVFGVTEKNVNVLYQLHNNTTVFEEKFISLSNENKYFKIPYKNEYGEGISVSLTYIKDGEFFNKEIIFIKEQEQTDLKLNTILSVFRDYLRPGQQELWTIKVVDSKGHPADAEVLASMYDISLDKIYKGGNWYFLNYRRNNVYFDHLGYTYSFRNSLNNRIRYQLEVPYNDSELRSKLLFYFDHINWGQNLANMLSGKVAGLATSVVLEESVVANALSDDYALYEEAPPIPVEYPYSGGNEDRSKKSRSRIITEISQPEIRRNFNETAFFYPQLRTNKKGETLISFTVPESLTKWNFRVLAHDKALRVGELSKMVQTQKELMVTPNMPRFLRQGDKTNISTKISNLSSSNIAGEVKIEFFDPTTEEVVNIEVANQIQKFSIDVNASTSTNWTFVVPENIEMLGCRIIAHNSQFSDGEQHALVVLSNRTLVTETMPIEAVKGEDNIFVFDKLRNNKSKTLENYRLTFEYTGNPVWYAVQALPVLSTPENENSVNWFASYYVNSLGSHIVKTQPKVSNMISTWNKAEQSSLISKLDTNKELKAVLLEETPWVLDAQNEDEQMLRLALLFDLNNSNYQTSKSLDKLKDLQTSEGGWSWYKGMKPSRSITQYILYGFAQLAKISQAEYSSDIKQMQSNALRYIDLQIIKDFEHLKKNDKNWKRKTRLSTTQMEYLYVRSFYPNVPIIKEALEAEKFYAEVAKKYWRLHNLYERSLLAVTLSNHGDKSIANPITRSLREYSFTSKKLGMYWPKNSSNVFMSQSAVSGHTFLMEALIENGASVTEIDNMKRWLLAQKRTQQWESTHATIDAINTLISTGSDWLSNKEKNPTVRVGRGNIFDLNKIGESGTAYVKYTWDKDEIDRSLAKVEVTQNSTSPSYGALYWQYFEDINKVSAQNSRGLKVEKLMFKEEGVGKDKKLVPITSEAPLKIGDRVVVRLTISTQKDMDFVQLKDMRAACFEPSNVLSGSRYQDGLFFYQTSKDASTNFFFDFMPKGTYVLEYSLVVNRVGEYSNGITTIQCAYAPEFISNTAGTTVIVK